MATNRLWKYTTTRVVVKVIPDSVRRQWPPPLPPPPPPPPPKKLKPKASGAIVYLLIDQRVLPAGTGYLSRVTNYSVYFDLRTPEGVLYQHTYLGAMRCYELLETDGTVLSQVYSPPLYTWGIAAAPNEEL